MRPRRFTTWQSFDRFFKLPIELTTFISLLLNFIIQEFQAIVETSKFEGASRAPTLLVYAN